ncbi:response regulator transcription factor [Streptosporangium sp. NPDC051022]|uniref:response regulator transcription factor n=1 Tax=Streptosporangium sp. NPDC051022 TaxID=3155752 RepID=UPI003429F7C6
MPESNDRIRIVVADDHTLFRDALCQVLRAEDDFHVVGDASDGPAVLSLAARTKPDIVLLDVEMPNHHPAHTLPRLLEISPPPKVIILSMHDDPQLVQDLLGAGAHGYLHKAIRSQELLLAIRSVHAGCHGVTVLVSQAIAPPPRPASQGVLTEREQEVLALVANALSNRQIAVQLAITEGTVKRHLRNIFGKLSAVSRIDAVNKAVVAAPSYPLIRPPQGQPPLASTK